MHVRAPDDRPPGDIAATCSACRSLPEWCVCDAIAPNAAVGDLLGDLRALIARYTVLPSAEAADAVTLWIAATYAMSAWEHATRLVIKSPEKRCGKSRLLDVIEATCHQPMITVNISPAALVRSIGDDPPTILLDEADTVFGRKSADNHEDLRGILNAGHQRNRPYMRWDVSTRSTEKCPTFAMAALACIGDLPDTIEDRAIVISMRRRAPRELVSPFRTRRDGPGLEETGRLLGKTIRQYADALRDAEPDMPVEDRAADTWEPLIAVADLAGGDWPLRAREAAKALTSDQAAEQTLGERLLRDLQTVFGNVSAMHGEMILAGLYNIGESPWASYYGRLLNPRDLADLLRPYGVRSRDVKVGGVTRKGYKRDDLHDPWTRYLSDPEKDDEDGATSATSATSEQLQGFRGSGNETVNATSATSHVSEVAEVADSGNRPLPENPCQTGKVAEVADVADAALVTASLDEWPDDSNGAEAN